MEIDITGLKCDNCTYRDDDVQFTDYEASIGKECPECGESLLTQAEFDSCLAMYKFVEHYNEHFDDDDENLFSATFEYPNS